MESAPQAMVNRALRLLLGVVLFGGTALVLAHDWLGFIGPSLDELSSGAIYDAVVVAAGIACLLRARAVPRERMYAQKESRRVSAGSRPAYPEQLTAETVQLTAEVESPAPR